MPTDDPRRPAAAYLHTGGRGDLGPIRGQQVVSLVLSSRDKQTRHAVSTSLVTNAPRIDLLCLLKRQVREV